MEPALTNVRKERPLIHIMSYIIRLPRQTRHRTATRSIRQNPEETAAATTTTTIIITTAGA